MDPNVRIAQEFRIDHRHDDGSWAPMDPMHHGVAEHDGERSWLRRTVFRCGSCGETVTVTAGDDEGRAAEVPDRA
jgi:hypothetical protein